MPLSVEAQPRWLGRMSATVASLVLCVVLLCAISLPASAAGRALIVGVAPAAIFSGNRASLEADVRKMSRVAERLGVPSSRIRTLLLDQAGRADFVAALNQLALGDVQTEDPVLIYFAGFGAPGPAGSESALVMSDSNAVWRDGRVTMEQVVSSADLSAMLQRIPSKRILVVVDTSRGAVRFDASALVASARVVVLTSTGQDLGADERSNGTRFTNAIHDTVISYPEGGEPLSATVLAEMAGAVLASDPVISGAGVALAGSPARATEPLTLVGSASVSRPPAIAAPIAVFPLTVSAEPDDARIRIMNIGPRYRAGMELEPGRYLLEVSSPGYLTESQWVELGQEPLEVPILLTPAPEPVQRPVVGSTSGGAETPPASAGGDGSRGSDLANVTPPESVSLGGADRMRTMPEEPLRDSLAGGGSGPRLRGITGGCFSMGSPSGESGRGNDENQHEVCVDSFWIGATEVTVTEYSQFLKASGYGSVGAEVKGCPDPRTLGVDELYAAGDINERPFSEPAGYRLKKQSDNDPVVCVSWKDASAYARWLSESTGKRYRLLTESQWEFAARAGSSSAYPWGGSVGKDKANCEDCISRWGASRLESVGEFQGHPWGLSDMAGNVKEWTCSGYARNYGGAELSCASGSAGGSRVVRGGSWKDRAAELRSANRSAAPPATRSNLLGFRVAREP